MPRWQNKAHRLSISRQACVPLPPARADGAAARWDDDPGGGRAVQCIAPLITRLTFALKGPQARGVRTRRMPLPSPTSVGACTRRRQQPGLAIHCAAAVPAGRNIRLRGVSCVLSDVELSPMEVIGCCIHASSVRDRFRSVQFRWERSRVHAGVVRPYVAPLPRPSAAGTSFQPPPATFHSFGAGRPAAGGCVQAGSRRGHRVAPRWR